MLKSYTASIYTRCHGYKPSQAVTLYMLCTYITKVNHTTTQQSKMPWNSIHTGLSLHSFHLVHSRSVTIQSQQADRDIKVFYYSTCFVVQPADRSLRGLPCSLSLTRASGALWTERERSLQLTCARASCTGVNYRCPRLLFRFSFVEVNSKLVGKLWIFYTECEHDVDADTLSFPNYTTFGLRTILQERPPWTEALPEKNWVFSGN